MSQSLSHKHNIADRVTAKIQQEDEEIVRKDH